MPRRNDYFVQAIALHRRGLTAQARSLYARVPADAPERAQALFLGAAAAHQEGLLEEAAEGYRQALTADPGQAEAALNLGLCLRSLGDASGAAAAFVLAVGLSPGDAASHLGLGTALMETGDLAGGLAEMRRAAGLAPDDPDAQNGLGRALRAVGDLDGAATAFVRAMELAPKDADARNNLGAVRKSQGRLGEAAGLFQEAAALDPAFAGARENLGDALRDMGCDGEARMAYEEARSLGGAPGASVKLALFTPMFPEDGAAIVRAREKAAQELTALARSGMRLEDPYAEVGYANFYLAYHGLEDRPLQEAAARMYLAACPGLAFTAPHCREGRAAGERVRIGFISAFLREHTIGKLNRRLIEALDPERFEKVVLRPAGPRDAFGRAIDAAVHKIVELPDDLGGARQAVARAACDILYYTDVGMDALTYFLSFARLAPAQCVTWGHPVTTGVPNMDYFLSMREMEPDNAQDSYSEALLLADGLSVIYDKPSLAGPPLGREAFGLPEDKRLYVCPQSLFKMHPDFDAAVIDILRRDPGGLCVFIHEPHPHPAEVFTARVARRDEEAARRLVFLPRMPPERFLHLLAVADCLLDTFPFGGGNTTLEAMAVGAAPVTLPGRFARGRITQAFYRLMGFTELVAADPRAYAELALRMARDRDFRQWTKTEIEARRDVLYGAPGVARAMERTFLRMLAERRAKGDDGGNA